MAHSVPKPKKKMLGKNLQFCFSKPKNILSIQFPPTPFTPNDQTPCPHSHSHLSTSSSSVSPHKPFKPQLPTFYDIPCSSSTSKSFTPSTSDFFSSDSETESLTIPTPPDFAAISASERFFVSSPGKSNSITDSSKELLQTQSLITGAIQIQTYSPDPYVDFRRSMVEMVEAKELFDVKANWDDLHELLLCYLSLNPKDTHKYIVAAFTDVLITLTSSEFDPPSRRTSDDVLDFCSVSNEKRVAQVQHQ